MWCCVPIWKLRVFESNSSANRIFSEHGFGSPRSVGMPILVGSSAQRAMRLGQFYFPRRGTGARFSLMRKCCQMGGCSSSCGCCCMSTCGSSGTGRLSRRANGGEYLPPAMIQLGDVAGCTGHIGKDTNPRPIISRLSRTRNQRVELGNDLLGALAEDDVFAGRMRL
jgi:hypothetical protein